MTTISERLQGGRLLRFALTLDGIATGATGLLFVALTSVLDTVLGVSPGLLLGVGLFFVAYGAVVLWIGTREVINGRAATAVAVVNLLWTVDSAVVLIAGALDLTALGTMTVLGLAAVTAGFGAAQLAGVRRG